jgi:hypothetical protein
MPAAGHFVDNHRARSNATCVARSGTLNTKAAGSECTLIYSHTIPYRAMLTFCDSATPVAAPRARGLHHRPTRTRRRCPLPGSGACYRGARENQRGVPVAWRGSRRCRSGRCPAGVPPSQDARREPRYAFHQLGRAESQMDTRRSSLRLWCPVIPRRTALFPSVPPEVKMMPSGNAPSSRVQTSSRAHSMAARACVPAA